MKSEVIYEVYSYTPENGFETLWLCKTKETAEYLIDWENASLYNVWYEHKEIWVISWENYERKYGLELKIGEVTLYE